MPTLVGLCSLDSSEWENVWREKYGRRRGFSPGTVFAGMKVVNEERAPHVLIVDDEALFRSSVVDAVSLSHPAWHVDAAADGEEALAASRDVDYDVIVTDLGMPVMDGFELLSSLSVEGYRGTTIVITAFGTPEVEHRVRRMGAITYLAKPVDVPHLLRTIEVAANRQQTPLVGLTVQGFSQLLEIEKKSCRLSISTAGNEGELVFDQGKLVDASTVGAFGQEAALEILSWQGTTLHVDDGPWEGTPTIDTPLRTLLLEAACAEDHRRRDKAHIHPVIGATSARPASAASAAPDSCQSVSDPGNGHKVRDDGLQGGSGRQRVDPSERSTALGSEVGEPAGGDVTASLLEALAIEGAIGSSLVDLETGLSLGSVGDATGIDSEMLSSGNSRVVRAKKEVMKRLGLQDQIEDILITLGHQYHLIRPLTKDPNLFLYLVLDRCKSNLAFARHQLSCIERDLAI